MENQKALAYAKELASVIQIPTVSGKAETDTPEMKEFRNFVKTLFPNLFKVCEYEEFEGSMLLKWKGKTTGEPVLFMAHYDVVEASAGKWTHGPFSGDIADGKVWGRGTLDNKGSFYTLFKAADELASEGFEPEVDTYFESSNTEESSSRGVDLISQALKDRGIHCQFVTDEGGMIMYEPVGGAKGYFAMVGVGEKCFADVKFTARSNGGHGSTPPKNTPLVRLGKFMAEVDSSPVFDPKFLPTVAQMFKSMAPSMKGVMKTLFGHPKFFGPLITKVAPSVSPVAAAMFRTTCAFTMAQGSASKNAIPSEAYVIANMRFSHHQGSKNSLEAIKKVADKYDIEMEVVDLGYESKLSPFDTEQFRNMETAIKENFEDVTAVPYIQTGATDSRYMSRICENCLRFAPFIIDNQQLGSMHGIDENVNIKDLPAAVSYYKKLISLCK